MPKTRPAYPSEFRRQMVDLVRAGRDPTDLAREFEPSAQAIRNWVAEVDRSEGRREAKLQTADTGLTTAERDELIRLRRENRQLKLERDILSRATAWSPASGMPPGPVTRTLLLGCKNTSAGVSKPASPTKPWRHTSPTD